MAKAKKQEKTIEQRLEEALVLYEKTPYELPSNWRWTTFEQIANLYTGNSINEREKELKYTGLSEGYNYIATKDIGFDYEIEYENGIKIPYEETRFKKARKGASLLCIEGGSAGRKSGFLQEEVCFVNKLCCFDFHGLVDKLYFYYLQSNEFFNLFNANKVGLIGGVSVNNLKQIAVPLAPLEEQKRIVEIIEKQFAKLDEARDLIQKSLDSFADRKSAILHKAFTGELTKNWREIRHKQFECTNKKLNEVCPLITDGTHQTPTYTDERGYIFLSSKNVRAGVIDWDNIKYIPESLHKELYSRLAPRKDDILLAKNGTTGIAAIVDRDCVFDIYVSLALIRPNILEVIPKYLLYVISTPEVKRYFDSSLKGIGVPNLHLKYIRETIIPIPSLDEQEEIVRILDSIFEKEDKSKELLDMLDTIDEMKKSILARAFRGQLGTSNPTDEPATDLLRKILEQSN